MQVATEPASALPEHLMPRKYDAIYRQLDALRPGDMLRIELGPQDPAPARVRRAVHAHLRRYRPWMQVIQRRHMPGVLFIVYPADPAAESPGKAESHGKTGATGSDPAVSVVSVASSA